MRGKGLFKLGVPGDGQDKKLELEWYFYLYSSRHWNSVPIYAACPESPHLTLPLFSRCCETGRKRAPIVGTKPNPQIHLIGLTLSKILIDSPHARACLTKLSTHPCSPSKMSLSLFFHLCVASRLSKRPKPKR